MTGALDNAVSAVVIGALMVFLLAFVPDVAKPLGPDMGSMVLWCSELRKRVVRKLKTQRRLKLHFESLSF